jgi:hypothetical protein
MSCRHQQRSCVSTPEVAKLFLVVLGGRIDGCQVELHDVRFVVGPTIETTIPELQKQWVGRRRGLHLDSWMEVRQIDGYAVTLARAPSDSLEKLWFVNVGGYDPSELLELHQIGLVVAPSAAAAKARAKKRLLPTAQQRHKDDLHAVDDCLPLDLLQGWHVQLRPNAAAGSQPQIPDWWGYRPIDRKVQLS